MSKVDMGGMGSSSMELMGSVILLHVLRVPFFAEWAIVPSTWGFIFLGMVSLMAG